MAAGKGGKFMGLVSLKGPFFLGLLCVLLGHDYVESKSVIRDIDPFQMRTCNAIAKYMYYYIQSKSNG